MKFPLSVISAAAFLLLSFTPPAFSKNNHRIIKYLQEGGEKDGSSYEKAVVISETTESAGVSAEYTWLKEYYPGYKLIKQNLGSFKGKPYDILHIKYKGKKKTIYFDISAFFGKL
jgi:hypothetical protein